MRLIADGVVDREGVSGLAARLAYSERQLHRLLVAELGAGPLALARAQRAQTARVLIETTDLRFADIAFASGFASIRQFNDTVREVFATTPSAMRTRGTAPAEAGSVTVRLAARRPFAGADLLAFLGATRRHRRRGARGRHVPPIARAPARQRRCSRSRRVPTG